MTTKRKVYVNGLPHATTDEQLEGLCQQHGMVKSAQVVLLFDKKTLQRWGFGFVEMESPDDNFKVIAALNRSDLNGSMLRCFSLSEPANGVEGAQGERLGEPEDDYCPGIGSPPTQSLL